MVRCAIRNTLEYERDWQKTNMLNLIVIHHMVSPLVFEKHRPPSEFSSSPFVQSNITVNV